jgi:hypothetical protein
MVFSVVSSEKRTMKKYLLLRDNQQSGPHSIEQLASIGLFPLDLVWIEDESTAWSYPEEIEELKQSIRYEGTPQNHQKKNEKVFISLPSNFSKRNHREMNEEYSSLPVNEMEPVLETNYVKPLEELKENYRSVSQNKSVWNKKIFQSSNGASVAAIFIGVVLGAIMIKKMVDGHVSTLAEQTTAIPIIDREFEKQPQENIKNAIVTEIVPVYKNAPKKISKPGNIKKQLKIKTNNYKVGVFGGINGLQLSIFNSSPQLVDKVIVALDYLKPNGTVVQSENVSFSSIKPLGVQTIAIPGSNRGVKVRYKILKVFAHNYKGDEKEA